MYVDGFVLAVPTKNLAAYKKLATKAGTIWMEHGALEYRESFGDDLDVKMGIGFRDLVIAKKTDTIVFSWIVYKDKKHRDAVNKKVMADSRMAPEMSGAKEMPFDVKRMSYGGFEIGVEFTATKSAPPRTAKRAPAKAAKKRSR